MKTVTLSDGKRVPALGRKTWRTRESRNARLKEVTALRSGIELD